MESRPDTEPRERPLAGLGAFASIVAAGTVLGLAIAGAGLWLGRPRAERPSAERAATGSPSGGQAVGGAIGHAPAVSRGSRSPTAGHTVPSGPAAPPVGAVARELERRHEAGELAEAQRRFEPCPGGDVRRVAWIERDQRVVKLARERADGLLVEEWFDGDGRLREARVQGSAGGRPWARHVTLDGDGREVEVGPPADLAPAEPPPALVLRDPTSAFFAGPGCAPEAR